MDAVQQLQQIIDSAGGTGPHMCAVCYQRMPTSEAKTLHMEQAHGYETLAITHIQGRA